MTGNGEEIRCPNCHLEQSRLHFYCCNCGQHLHQPLPVTQPMSKPSTPDFDGQAKKALVDLEDQAERIEIETFEKIQGRVEKWLKTSGYYLIFAVALLGLFGYKGFSDLHQALNEGTEKIKASAAQSTAALEETRRNAEQQTTVALQKLQEALQKADPLPAEIEQITLKVKEAQGQLAQVRQLEQQLRTALAQADEIRSEVKEERENVQKLQHSFFAISLHLEGARDRLDRTIPQVAEALDQRGFRLNRADIVEIGVNQTEVLYYNSLAREQAELLAQLLQQALGIPKINTRLLSLFERNPREILIKLKLP